MWFPACMNCKVKGECCPNDHGHNSGHGHSHCRKKQKEILRSNGAGGGVHIMYVEYLGTYTMYVVVGSCRCSRGHPLSPEGPGPWTSLAGDPPLDPVGTRRAGRAVASRREAGGRWEEGGHYFGNTTPRQDSRSGQHHHPPRHNTTPHRLQTTGYRPTSVSPLPLTSRPSPHLGQTISSSWV